MFLYFQDYEAHSENNLFLSEQVIKTLDPKLNPASAEIMLLRKQLAEKERRIEILEVNLPYLLISP